MGDKMVDEPRELPVADGHPLHIENERILGVSGGYVHQLMRLLVGNEKLETLNLGVAIPTDTCWVVVQEGLNRQVIGAERDQWRPVDARGAIFACYEERVGKEGETKADNNAGNALWTNEIERDGSRSPCHHHDEDYRRKANRRCVRIQRHCAMLDMERSSPVATYEALYSDVDNTKRGK